MTQNWFFTLIGLGVFLSMFSAVAALRIKDKDLWYAWGQMAAASVVVIVVFALVRSHTLSFAFPTVIGLGRLLLFFAVLPSAFATRAALRVTMRDAAPEWGELVVRSFVAYCVASSMVFVIAIVLLWLLLGGLLGFGH